MFRKLLRQGMLTITVLQQISSFAHAGAFEDTADVSIDLTMSAPASILLSDDVMTFSDLVAGDTINATQNITLSGASSRNFTCNIGGQELTNDYPIFSSLVTLTVSLDGCDATSGGNIQILSVTSTQFPSGIAPGATDSAPTIVIVLSYDVDNITLYS